MTAQGAESVPVELVALAAAVGIALVVLLVVLLRPRDGRRAAVSSTATDPPPEPGRDCGACGRTLLPGWTACPFCGWAPPPPLAAVEFVGGPLEGQVFELQADVTTVGSVAGNTIVLADPAVSKKHIGIRRDPAGYELADLGSTNGVFVNGQKMAKRLLSSGDIIRLGTSEMVFRIEKVG